MSRWLSGDGWLGIDCEIRVFRPATVVERGRSWRVNRGIEGQSTWSAMLAGALPELSDGGGLPPGNVLEAILTVSSVHNWLDRGQRNHWRIITASLGNSPRHDTQVVTTMQGNSASQPT